MVCPSVPLVHPRMVMALHYPHYVYGILGARVRVKWMRRLPRLDMHRV